MKLKRWTLPPSYFGAQWPEYYVFLAQHRGSDALTRSNFRSGWKAIGGETETVFTVLENHWAVGWVEWIAIHESDTAALETANQIMERLEDYPVVDEEDYSREEFEEACASWEGMTIRDRMELLQRHRLNIFASRRAELPQGLPYFDELLSR